MRDRVVSIIAVALSLAPVASAGTLSLEVSLHHSRFTNRLRAYGFAAYTKGPFDFGEVWFYPLFLITETSAFHNTPERAATGDTWSKIITSSSPPEAPNCYTATLHMRAEPAFGAAVEAIKDSPNTICWSGPAPQAGLQPVCEYENDPELGTIERCYSPLVLDLDDDGVKTTGTDNPVRFDINATGAPELITWTDPAEDDAFLFLDFNKNHVVDDGQELFGTASLKSDERAVHGFDALSLYDEADQGGNSDGKISAADRVWGKLRLWIDHDHDGVSDGHETSSLGAEGVVSISLAYAIAGASENYGRDTNGNHHYLRGTFVRRIGAEERTQLAEDVFFRRAD